MSAFEAATTAVFSMQLSMLKATKFVQRHAGVSEKQAQEAIRNAATWYKNNNR